MALKHISVFSCNHTCHTMFLRMSCDSLLCVMMLVNVIQAFPTQFCEICLILDIFSIFKFNLCYFKGNENALTVKFFFE